MIDVYPVSPCSQTANKSHVWDYFKSKEPASEDGTAVVEDLESDGTVTVYFNFNGGIAAFNKPTTLESRAIIDTFIESWWPPQCSSNTVPKDMSTFDVEGWLDKCEAEKQEAENHHKRAVAFVEELWDVMKRHQMILSHEDEHGGFLVGPLNGRTEEWYPKWLFGFSRRDYDS